jgi:predicted PhzF superfamily epimerase YddE/YHI9
VLTRVAKWNVRGLIITAKSDQEGIDFISRCFFPALNIDEDPVTGSAHCALAVYWQGILGRDTMVGYQASPRGGKLICEVQGDRVLLTGRAITTVRGALLV